MKQCSAMAVTFAILVPIATSCTALLKSDEWKEGGRDHDSSGTAPEGPANSVVDRNVPCDINVLGDAPVRRLSHVEYQRTITDLFPGLNLNLTTFAPDRAVHGFENYASQLNPSELLVEQYFTSALSIAESVLDQDGSQMPCDLESGDSECALAWLTDLGERIFRRPLTEEDVTRYLDYFEDIQESISFRGAAELTLASLLISPQFLYRLEFSGEQDDAEQTAPLNAFELATRLSYLLWQSTPDDELLDAAHAGTLDSEEGLLSQAERLLQNERATSTLVDFHRQWLALDGVRQSQKDPDIYPWWNDGLRDDIHEESLRFVEHVFSEGRGTFAELWTSQAAWVNGPLAELYGNEAPNNGEDWHLVSLDPSQRSGILTRASFSAGFGKSTNGSPPLRGVAIMDRVFCSHPPAPPAELDLSVNQDPNAPTTNRKLFESRTAVAPCSNCHALIDGIGFTFEHYDSTGRYREIDNGEAVDATGALIGTDVDGPLENAVELSARIAESDDAAYCAATQWYRFTFGRDEKKSEWCKTDSLFEAFKENDGDVRALLLSIVRSQEFRHRPTSSSAE